MRKIWVLGLLAALAACSGHSGGAVPSGLSNMNRYPASISPGSIHPGPMVQTPIQPSSAMRSPQSNLAPMAAIQGMNYTQIPGSASFAAAAPDGSLWVLSDLPAGPDKYIWHYSGGTWTNISGLASRIAVAPNGTLYVINSLGSAYSYSGGTWTGFGGGCRDLTAAADGSLYVISNGGGADGAIWHYASGAWTQQPGSGNRLTASWDPNTYSNPGGTITPYGFYVINSLGSIYYLSSGGYIQIPGAGSAVAAMNGGLFVLGFPTNPAGNTLYYYDLNNPGWSTKGGSGVSISTNGNTLYIIGGGGGIYKSTIIGSMSSPISFMMQNSTTQVSGNIFAGSTAALLVGISGAGDLSGTSSSGVSTDTLSVNSGSQTMSAARSIGAQSAVRAFSLPAHMGATERFPSDDNYTNDHIRARLIPAGAASPVRRTMSVLPSSPTVGSTANIWVNKFSIGSSSGTYSQIPATLESQTAHGNFWVDNTLLSGTTASPSFQGAALANTATALGNDFENAYASDTTHFASPDYSDTAPALQTNYLTCAPDGTHNPGGAPAFIYEPPDKRINIMLLNSANLGSGVGGYFSSVNYYTQGALNCNNGATSAHPAYSNEAPMIYVGWSQGNGATFELQEDLVRGTAHEFQHLINFVQHSIVATNAAGEDTFINEGLSMLAQDLAVTNLYPNVAFDVDDAMQRGAAYLAAPGNFSLSGFVGIDSSSWGGNGTAQKYNCGGGCYGSAYLFQRYLRDRFGGDTYTRGMETSGVTKYANLQANCMNCGETGTQLGADFAMAIAANTLNASSTDPRFRFGTLNLLGTYNDQFNNPMTLTGVSATPLGANASGSLPVLVGGMAYASISAPPAGGENVLISDPNPSSGFSLMGGLAQH